MKEVVKKLSFYYQDCVEMTVFYGLSDDCVMMEMNDPCLLSCYGGMEVIVLQCYITKVFRGKVYKSIIMKWMFTIVALEKLPKNFSSLFVLHCDL